MLRTNRSFVKMFVAYGLSAFGDYFDFMAVSILLGFIWKLDAMTIALFPLSYALPGILFSQLAGLIADRRNRRNMMIASDLVRAFFTVMMIFAPNAWVLLGLIAFCLIGLAGIQMIDTHITVLLRDAAPHRPELIGWLVTAVGAGGLASVAWLRRFKRISAYGWMLGGGLVLIGLMFAAAGMYEQETASWLLLSASFIGGIGTGFTSTGMNYILQKDTPLEAIGRVSGIYDSLSSMIFVIAPLAGGALIGMWGASFTFIVVGMAVGSVGLAGVALQRLLWRSAKPVENARSFMA